MTLTSFPYSDFPLTVALRPGLRGLGTRPARVEMRNYGDAMSNPLIRCRPSSALSGPFSPLRREEGNCGVIVTMRTIPVALLPTTCPHREGADFAEPAHHRKILLF